MADILVPGMKIPTACISCDFFNLISSACTRRGTKIEFENLTQTLENCPLIELSEHGDLIDLDARVDKQFYDEINKEWSIRTVTVRDLLNSIVEEMPSIVIPSNKEATD